MNLFTKQKLNHRCRKQTYGCCAKLLQSSCPTLCNPMDCSPAGSSVHGGSPSKNTGVGYNIDKAN